MAHSHPDSQKVWRFALTGGPCAGKTTALSILDQVFTKHGYKVIVIPETATEVISSGISPTELPVEIFQDLLIKRSLNKEDTVDSILPYFEKDVVILYDRGLLDNKAYMSYDTFLKVLKNNDLTENEARDRYDGVFHLVTAADGAEEFYTCANNQARKESPEEARALDKKTKDAWIGHPHLRIIDNSTSFKEKMNKLVKEISAVIGIPTPIETERKFLIAKPSFEILTAFESVELDIVQMYLCSNNPNIERRIRQRGSNREFSYFYTEKRTISPTQRIELEKKISKNDYIALLAESEKTIRKKRFCFLYKNQSFELDIYPDWEDTAILEIELLNENQPIDIPSELTVIKEVTGDPKYFNANLAK